jgi:hypothetical protein
MFASSLCVSMRVCRPWVDVKSSYEIQIKQEEKKSPKKNEKLENRVDYTKQWRKR